MSSEVLTDLNLVLDEVEKHEDIRVVIVSGQGDKAFVAGADIKEMDPNVSNSSLDTDICQ